MRFLHLIVLVLVAVNFLKARENFPKSKRFFFLFLYKINKLKDKINKFKIVISGAYLIQLI